jgi:hypothetical protein
MEAKQAHPDPIIPSRPRPRVQEKSGTMEVVEDLLFGSVSHVTHLI